MRRVSLILILVILSTTLGGCFFGPRKSVKKSDRPSTTAMLEGQVVDADQRPLPGASVTVMGSTQTALTGPDGKFILSGLPGDTQSVIVRKDNYLTGVITVDLTPATGRILSTVPVLQLLSLDGSLHMDSSRIPPVPGKGPCAQCHRLHTPTDYLADGGKNDSCYKDGCHLVTKAAGRFPNRSVFDNSPHRLSVWPGQTSPGNCGSCHEPHGIVGTPVMLRLGQTVAGKRSTNLLCYGCHQSVGSGAAAGWPGRDAYINSGNKHNSIVDPGNKYVNGDCLICHVPHGQTWGGVSDPVMLRQKANDLCRSCHTDKLSAASGHNGNCVMCHNPHDVGASSTAAKVKNPAGGTQLPPKNTYRSQALIKNEYCEGCHRATPPTGLEAAKDPATETGFTNLEAKPDTSLHRVHASKIRPDETWLRYRGSQHPEYPFRHDVNNVRCVTCHAVHQIASAQNVRTDVIGTRIRSASPSGYNGKAGCGSLAYGCHSCNYCHAEPGGPGDRCWNCDVHGDPTSTYHGVVY